MASGGLGAGWHVKFSFTLDLIGTLHRQRVFKPPSFCIRKLEILKQPTPRSPRGSAGELSARKRQAVPLRSLFIFWMVLETLITADIPLARSNEHGFLKSI